MQLTPDTLYVVYTAVDETLAALRVAEELAESLDLPLALVCAHEVPFTLPLDAPVGVSPVETDAFVDRVKVARIDVCVRVYRCRDERDILPVAFTPHSVVVLGAGCRRISMLVERWRVALEAAGHVVIVAHRQTDAVSAQDKEASRA